MKNSTTNLTLKSRWNRQYFIHRNETPPRKPTDVSVRGNGLEESNRKYLRCERCRGQRSPSYHSKHEQDPRKYPSIGTCSRRRTGCITAKSQFASVSAFERNHDLVYELPADWDLAKPIMRWMLLYEVYYIAVVQVSFWSLKSESSQVRSFCWPQFEHVAQSMLSRATDGTFDRHFKLPWARSKMTTRLLGIFELLVSPSERLSFRRWCLNAYIIETLPFKEVRFTFSPPRIEELVTMAGINDLWRGVEYL